MNIKISRVPDVAKKIPIKQKVVKNNGQINSEQKTKLEGKKLINDIKSSKAKAALNETITVFNNQIKKSKKK